MGKRSEFERLPKDKYYTWDSRAYQNMDGMWQNIGTFVEPCAGAGNMVYHLSDMGMSCVYACDIEPEGAGIALHSYEMIPGHVLARADAIITNPPWSRGLLHPFIDWCIKSGKPSWLLIDTAWAATRQAKPYLAYCSHIVPTPRLKWIKDSEHAAKDDTSWYRFQNVPCPTVWVSNP